LREIDTKAMIYGGDCSVTLEALSFAPIGSYAPKARATADCKTSLPSLPLAGQMLRSKPDESFGLFVKGPKNFALPD